MVDHSGWVLVLVNDEQYLVVSRTGFSPVFQSAVENKKYLILIFNLTSKTVSYYTDIYNFTLNTNDY